MSTSLVRPLTPACTLIVTKIRELMKATSDEVLSRIHIAQVDMLLVTGKGDPTTVEMWTAVREHISTISPDEVAKEFVNTVEGIINIGDEHIIMQHCRFVTRAILEESQKDQAS